MLRRYRTLKKIVYAATILFATIVLYAGTSFNDYDEDRRREWILPIVARDMYHVDAALQEPIHRLPLGPFEDHPVSIMVESLQMQIPTFEDDTEPEEFSNFVPANFNDAAPRPTALAPVETHPPHDPEVAPGSPQSAHVILLPQSNSSKSIPPVPDISAAAAIPPAPTAPSDPVGPPIAAILPGQTAPSAIPNTASLLNPIAPRQDANPSPNFESNIVVPGVPKPQSPTAIPAAPHNPPQPPPAIPAAPRNPPQPHTKPLPDLNKTIAEMNVRLNHTRFQCEKFKVPNQIDSDVYQLPQFNISYCKIPKAGCTYWEQVISYLNKPPYQLSYLGVKMPFQISKFDIRYTSHFNLPRRDFMKEDDKAEIMKSSRVMFVRHPLERLWSCYLEKFYLIDFWTTAGTAMKTLGADVKCPKAITFREFIDFTLPLFNENWAPMTELCNPCVFLPHIIGHVETLREDSYYALKQINQDWIFAEHDKFSREENQMLDMAIYNYQIHSIHWYSFYHKCLAQKELASKLWDVFKKVGYLSSHAALPDNLTDYNQTTIIKELRMQFRKFPLGPINGRAQQLKMMRRDFESLPKPTMAKILERYAMDFQLFGYSTQLPLA